MWIFLIRLDENSFYVDILHNVRMNRALGNIKFYSLNDKNS